MVPVASLTYQSNEDVMRIPGVSYTFVRTARLFHSKRPAETVEAEQMIVDAQSQLTSSTLQL